MQLEESSTVGSVRITTVQNTQQDGYRLSPFRIRIDDAYCTQQGGALDWTSAHPGTAEFTCSQALQGSNVTIELPGYGRILQLCEVQVFEVSLPYFAPASTHTLPCCSPLI